uniref:RNase H type-1 domain-containing protein n=1 Tax=Quercus lobata TaxID=97700 RepID=A0A7N2KU00_QUELO
MCENGRIVSMSSEIHFLNFNYVMIRDGLNLATQLGIQNIEVELDAKKIIDLLHSNFVANRSFSLLLNDCRSLLRKFHQVRVEHVFREANFCADALARRGVFQTKDFAILDAPPSIDIISYVNSDANGLYYGRLTIATLAIMAS